MEKTPITLQDIKILGLSVRTSFRNECSSTTAIIPQVMEKYWREGIAERIPHRKSPGVLYAAYTEYESDYRGEYTYFVGEEVTKCDAIPDNLSLLVIPGGIYTKLTTKPGVMPQVIIEAWQKIWNYSEQDLGGKRLYHTDFERYDERALDPCNTVADVYIGINSLNANRCTNL